MRATLGRCFGSCAILLCLTNCQNAQTPRDSDMFGIYTAEMDGDDHRAVLTHARQEMTHARVSPDRKWIVFTRYTQKGPNGLAMEDHGYAGTEIVRASMDGSGVETLVPAKRGVVNSNCSWIEGGDAVMYVSTDNPQRQPRIMKLDLETRKKTRVPTPEDWLTTDPDAEGDKIVFARKGETVDRIYMMNRNGSEVKQVTNPKIEKTDRTKFHVGDYDPKLSPDLKKVATMRFHGGEDWRIVVVDLATGKEHDLSGAENLDAMPDWSADGQRIIFRHIDRKRPRDIGVWTMKPDGTDRKQVPLPRRRLHNHPAFFPGAEAGPDAKVIYVSRSAPRIP